MSEASYRQLIDSAGDAIFVHDGETGALIDVNDTMLKMYRVTREQALGSSADELSDGSPPYTMKEAQMWLRKTVNEGPQVFDWMARRGTGELFPVEVSLSKVSSETESRIIAVVRDVSRRKQAEDALEDRTRFENFIAELSNRFVSVPVDDVDAAIESSLEDIARFADVDGGYVMQFSEDRKLFGLTHLWTKDILTTDKNVVKDLSVGAMPWWMGKIFNNEVVAVPSVAELPEEASVEKSIISSQGVKAVIDVPMKFQGKVVGFLGFNSTREGRHWTAAEISLMRFVGQVFLSALERKKSEQALRKSEEQLLQAQKMEAIGRLTGGIAHDFNNLLTAIIGYSEIVRDRFDADDPTNADVSEILSAGLRGATLTRQLLAFSRKQVNKPRVIQVNEVIDSSQKMLGRIIGEDIELLFNPAPDLRLIKMDPGQIDQILVNMATNSRDAMPDGGRLSITTENVTFDKTNDTNHGLTESGNYVRLTIDDNGAGISRNVMDRIFEPFFSTKEEGKGTGLGLSTVYGLVKQNKGLITVASEPGVGTTFTILLPATQDEPTPLGTISTETTPPTGAETILLVEDEQTVRKLASQVLSHLGYQVTAACDTAEACKLIEQDGHTYDLLLTDVVMPDLNGPELYERLLKTQQDLKCLFMSGYAENLIVHHGVADPGKRLLQKPFSMESLARGIRNALDRQD